MKEITGTTSVVLLSTLLYIEFRLSEYLDRYIARRLPVYFSAREGGWSSRSSPWCGSVIGWARRDTANAHWCSVSFEGTALSGT